MTRSTLDAVAGEEGDRAAQEADGGRGLSRRRALRRRPGGCSRRRRRARTPSRLPARLLVAAWVARAGRRPVTRWPAPLDAAELLDVDVDQLAGPRALVAVGRLGRLQPRALAQPDPLQAPPRPSRAASPGTSAISAPVIRSRRSARSPRRAPPACGAGSTAAPRSDRAVPARPRRGSAPTHFAHVRSLTPAASAASASDHPCSSTRSDHRPPALRTERRVSVKLHPVSSLGLSGLTPPASKEARM